jgi:putative Holliday junction resolvase
VDHGAKRVGLAVADPLRLFAQPIGTFGPGEALDRLRRLHAEEGIATVVVGWPLAPDGAEGAGTRRVQPFVDRIRRSLAGVEVLTLDERDSSARAVEALAAGGARNVSRREPGRIDAAAASLILQDFLDELRSGAREEE